MRVSQVGIFLLLGIVVLFGTNCNVYNKVLARKNVVDGAEAFKGRKFDEAEALFRQAANRAPVDSEERKTALLFLARTLHSQFASNRKETAKAEEAISEYRKVLEVNPNDGSSFKAVANLYKNLEKNDDWRKWVTDRSENTAIPNEQRAEAYTSLASEESSCANDITEDPAVKKTVQQGGKAIFTFSKPADPATLEKLKGCIQKGSDLIGKALALETDIAKNAKTINVKALSDKELKEKNDQIKPFESARSYNTSLLIQSMRLAEMEGRAADKDKFKAEADAAREKFKELGDITKAIKDEQDERVKIAAGEDTNANAASK
jgi:tetratricopeptide (TPR) repeat protein